MKRTSNRGPIYRGITLVETLAAVGIIALLSAILYPMFHQVKRSAKSVSCISNLRQLGAALALYEGDNDGKFPPTNPRKGVNSSGIYPDPLGAYGAIQDIYHCPDFGGTRAQEYQSDYYIRFGIELLTPANFAEFWVFAPEGDFVTVYCNWNLLQPLVLGSTTNGCYNCLYHDGSVRRVRSQDVKIHYDNWGGFPPTPNVEQYRFLQFPGETFPPGLIPIVPYR